MTLPISILFLFIIIYFTYKKNLKALLFLILLSLMGDMFKFNFFGSKIIIYQLISLLFLPVILKHKIPKNISSIVKGIKLEYILLVFFGIIYGFILPWDDGEISRSWSQKSSGRSLVALFSILSTLILVYVTFLFFIQKKVKLQNFINVFSILIIVISTIAFFDLLFNYPIYKLLFGQDSITSAKNGRLLGFSIEPRSLGRWMVQGWCFLLIYKINGYRFKFSNISLIMGAFVIFFTFSFSTYFLFLISIIFLLRNYILKIKITQYLLFGLALFLGQIYFVKNQNIYDIFKYKFDLVTLGKEDNRLLNEPAIFTQFEIFDRAALNFFYNYPKHLIFGTGPNLISIPSSKYIDDSAYKIFGGYLIGIPGSGLINLVSRSGFIGLILYIFLFFKIFKYLGKNKLLKNIFSVMAINFIFSNIAWIYFIIGFVLAQQYNFNKYKNLKC